MRSLCHGIVTSVLFLFVVAAPLVGAERFRPLDVFELEWATDPRISPSGDHVAYVRNGFDVMTDGVRSDLWIVASDGTHHRPLVAGEGRVRSPRWSPTGDRILFIRSDEDGAQLAVCWMEGIGAGDEVAGPACRTTATITHLTESPSSIAWSPDGGRIAFSMRVPEDEEPLAELPPKPEGAEWAKPPRTIDELIYRTDGGGYVEAGYRHLFVLPVEGGTPRQLTTGEFDHESTPRWTPDGEALVFSANREQDWRFDPLDSELYELRIDDGRITALTDRQGPDAEPALSPDGRRIAYVGFDDEVQGYQISRLYVVGRDGSNPRPLTASLDRSVEAPRWSADGERVYFQYDDEGDTEIAYATLDGTIHAVADGLGGTSLGRPYPGGSFSISDDGRIAYTLVGTDHPADVAVVDADGEGRRRLTALNRDLFTQRQLGEVEEIWYESSHDGRRIHGWLVTPPGFDPGEGETTYPLLLEIHGGPFTNYGPRFATEMQLYAARGYVVLYTNPRGSTSYGEEFGNLIHHAYPGHDFDDLMSGVDAVLARGFVDPERLYVTGGSGGGVLSAWIVGSTDRFRAAAVQKPVINWLSFALTADLYTFFHRYWFPAPPWEDPMGYWKRSPLSRVGAVSTPTLIVTGEEDFRTPISESEQLYQALKLRRVEATMVRLPGASHHIAARPSQLLAKVLNVLGWFERYGGPGAPEDDGR